jgi:hypothetical protein
MMWSSPFTSIVRPWAATSTPSVMELQNWNVDHMDDEDVGAVVDHGVEVRLNVLDTPRSSSPPSSPACVVNMRRP